MAPLRDNCEHTDEYEDDGRQGIHAWLRPDYRPDAYAFFRRATIDTDDAERAFPPEPALGTEERQEFERHLKRWRSETEHMSSVSRMVAHESYFAIIKLGLRYPNQVVPLILKELRRRPDYWFAALETITEQNFRNPDGDFDRERKAWLKWGRSRDYLRRVCVMPRSRVLESRIPKPRSTPYSVTSGKAVKYNCVAWVFGDRKRL